MGATSLALARALTVQRRTLARTSPDRYRDGTPVPTVDLRGNQCGYRGAHIMGLPPLTVWTLRRVLDGRPMVTYLHEIVQCSCRTRYP
jgi:hypothetical protein